MTKHFKANEDVEIDGTFRAAGSFFSRGDEPSAEVDEAIANGQIVNVAEGDVPEAAQDEAPAQEAPEESPKDEDAGSDSSSENEPVEASEAPAEDTATAGSSEGLIEIQAETASSAG